MDRRRPLLVNEGEFRTDEVLREAAADLGYGVHTKVRMADALDIDRSGLSNDAYSYALRAHFDWVVTDLGTTTPEFAVEFDGDSHTAAPVRRRDALKDEVCEKLGLPLLRIDRAGYRPTIRRSVIWYLVESWRLMKSWHEAQDKGIIPLDEDFEPWMFIEGQDDNGYLVWRDMAAPCRRLVARLWGGGALEPWLAHAYRASCAEDPDHAEAYAWVKTAGGDLVVGRARLRTYSFPAVFDFDLAEDLAHIDLAARLSRLTEGDRSVVVDPGSVVLPTIGTGSPWGGGHTSMHPPAA